MDEDRLYPLENDLEQIAVIGMAGRFPGASSIEEFWGNLCGGVESIAHYSTEELRARGIPDDWLLNPSFVKSGTHLQDFDGFDAAFFGYSPREALLMDPQQRLFLETSWHAIENAGYNPENFDGPIGVFAGTSPNAYRSLLRTATDPSDVAGHMELMIGSGSDYVATRVSYKLNLKGPSLAVQTACSTSLTAVQLACQSLLTYQCSLAIAGGASVDAARQWGYFYQEGAILSPDGRCRAFDAKAGGTVVGQGVGAVVLKRLSEALTGGDHIYAVIKGCAINNDGDEKIGYTAPSVKGQAEVIALAQALSGVTADSITYVEAHGTGTKLGDPIEISALTSAFRVSTLKKGFCAVGSVKTNIGHADAAAGIAGLIKTALMLRHKKIPPSLHFEKPNLEIDFENSPFYVAAQLTDWEVNGFPRRAGVSSLGIGGTNVHVVLEEAPVRPWSGHQRPYQLLLLSANTPSALEAAAQNLCRHFEGHLGLSLADAAYTLAVGRKHFKHRAVFVGSDAKEITAGLRHNEAVRMSGGIKHSGDPSIVFMFTGQGAQYPNMGRQLYLTEPVFREALDACFEILSPLLSTDLRSVMYPDGGDLEKCAAELNQTALAQPALFAVEYALAMLWQSWGIRPKAMVGHSIGEYVAACLANVIPLEAALAVVAARGHLMQELPYGAMLAVVLSESEIRTYLNDRVSLAAVNAPSLCVVSGEFDAVEDLERRIAQDGIGHKRLATSHAFHSHMMDPAVDKFVQEMGRHELRPPQIPFLSNVTGSWITAEQATWSGYWAGHLRRTVRFSDCLKTLLGERDPILLEVGPGQTLCSLAKQHAAKTAGLSVFSSMRSPREKRSDVELILTTLGKLWLVGCAPDWSAFFQQEPCRRLPLPGYPFERRRFWPEVRPERESAKADDWEHLLRRAEPSVKKSDFETSPPTRIQVDGSAFGDIAAGLIDIWKRLIGVEAIGLNDDFFELGGSSLLAVRLFAEIEKHFNKRLPLATLLEAPTISKLAEIIADKTSSGNWSCLVAVRRQGTRPPFFCIHAAGGNLIMYRDLARHLGQDQPFYGLQSQGMDGSLPFLTCIEEMASLYLKEIQSIQPRGPYLLGGYCMGGTIALEIAQQLYAQGQTVGLLALFETYNWARVRADSLMSKAHHYLQKVEFHARNLVLADDAAAFFREKINVARSRKGIWREMIRQRLAANSRHREIFYDLWQSNDAAAMQYQAKPYPGKITLFRAYKQYAMLDTPAVGWEEIAAGGLDVRKLKVYPAGMLVEPFVRRTAFELNRCIEAAL